MSIVEILKVIVLGIVEGSPNGCLSAAQVI